MNTATYKGFVVAYKGIFAVMPLTMSPTVHDMSNDTGQARTKAMVSVAGKTYTEEELACMANAEIAARFNLPNDKLLALAAKYPPPPEWLKTVEEKPF